MKGSWHTAASAATLPASTRAGWRRHARRVNPFYFIGGAAVVAAIALFFSFYTLGTTVEYNGSVVDTVASAAQARKAASKLESITTETLGKSYEIAKDAIHYSTAFVRRSDVTDSTTFEQEPRRRARPGDLRLLALCRR